MTKQIDIKELIPFLRDGWVSMDEDGTWSWNCVKPVMTEFYWGVDITCIVDDPRPTIDLSDCFNIAPAKDWTKSLIKIERK